MLVVLLPVVAAALFLAAPGELEAKLALALRGVCAQRPEHALGFDGGPVVLEARMLGIFIGFAVAVAIGWLRGGVRRSELPRGWIGLILLLGIAAMAVDGVNAALYDLGLAHLYVPQNGLRLATGLLCGLGMAGFIAPVVSFVWWRRRVPVPLFASWTDLAWAASAVTVAGVVVGLSTLPAQLLGALALLAVFGSFWLVSTYVAVLAWEGPGRAESWPDLGAMAVVGFGLTIAELLAMSMLRTWMEGTLGVSWVV
jgi:uncharacterized membrane protein